ncbi:MAG: 50S ribosomal protein L24 [Candidatus Omnitrophica bacterium]|nr:50S ribosomal protein L24 [Candidatus Omnitrophota bacterium]
MLKIRKGDTVEVIRGDDKGKKGKVLALLFTERRALVEGINLVKKHKRKTQQEPQGGIVSIETPVSLSNLALFCKRCNAAVRVGFNRLADGTKIRICKTCKEDL